MMLFFCFENKKGRNVKILLLKLLEKSRKQFSWRKYRNIKFFKIFLIPGYNIVAIYGSCACSNKTIFEIFCLFLKCDEHIFICDTADFDNLQKLSDCLISDFGIASIFFYNKKYP